MKATEANSKAKEMDMTKYRIAYKQKDKEQQIIKHWSERRTRKRKKIGLRRGRRRDRKGDKIKSQTRDEL